MSHLRMTPEQVRAHQVRTQTKPSKYRNTKTVVDGITFHSVREARRYAELKMLELAIEIRDLKLQPTFHCVVNGITVCKYIADFSYTTRSGKEIVEDVKGYKTPSYKLKRKLVLACFAVDILETRCTQRTN